MILVEKIFTFSTKKEIAGFLKNMDFPAFLSKLTTSNDLMKVAFFLLISETALQKLPELFVPFLREGIIDFVDKLSLDEEMKFLQLFPLFKPQSKLAPTNFDFKQFKYGFNPYSSSMPLDLNANPLGIEKPMGIEVETGMEDEIYGIEKDNLLQTIQKDSKETEETLKEFAEEMNSGLGEKSKYMELFQKFKKTREKIQQTAELLQKTHKKMDILKLEKKELGKPLTAEDLNNEKLKEIKLELSRLANRIISHIKTCKDFNALDVSSTNEIMNNLKEIISHLKNSGCDEDYGYKGFQIFISVLEKYKRITLYEMKNSNIVKSLLEFLLDGTLQKLESEKSKGENLFQEEVKMNEGEKKCEEVSLTAGQIPMILKRLFLFVYVLLKKSPNNPQGSLIILGRRRIDNEFSHNFQ